MSLYSKSQFYLIIWFTNQNVIYKNNKIVNESWAGTLFCKKIGFFSKTSWKHIPKKRWFCLFYFFVLKVHLFIFFQPNAFSGMILRHILMRHHYYLFDSFLGSRQKIVSWRKMSINAFGSICHACKRGKRLNRFWRIKWEFFGLAFAAKLFIIPFLQFSWH